MKLRAYSKALALICFLQVASCFATEIEGEKSDSVETKASKTVGNDFEAEGEAETETPDPPLSESSGPSLPSRPASISESSLPLAKPTLSGSIKAFNQRRFGEALRQFQILDKTGFCNDNVHYYMGRCYQQLSQVAPALQNYDWVVKYSKNRTLKSYAELASGQLNKYKAHRTYQGAPSTGSG